METSLKTRAWHLVVPPGFGFLSFFRSRDSRSSTQVLGQVTNASAGPFVMAPASRVAVTWFPEYERVVATAVCATSNGLGVAVGAARAALHVYFNLSFERSQRCREHRVHPSRALEERERVTPQRVRGSLREAPETLELQM